MWLHLQLLRCGVISVVYCSVVYWRNAVVVVVVVVIVVQCRVVQCGGSCSCSVM